MLLQGLHAVVTGSTSGIGLAVAEKLASEGCNVALNSHSPINDDIQKICDEVNARSSADTIYMEADMSQPDSIRKGLAGVMETFGKIDILINNAGIQFTAPVEDFPDEKWQAILAIDLSACFYGIKAVLPGMKERNFGRIINIASAHGLVASPHKAAYVAAKHGLLGLTKTVAIETAEQDITCNAICPGWVDTPLVRRQIQDRAKENGTTEEEETRKLVGEKQPNMRFAKTDDLGNLAVYLSRSDVNSMTGAALPVDGGWTAW